MKHNGSQLIHVNCDRKTLANNKKFVCHQPSKVIASKTTSTSKPTTSISKPTATKTITSKTASTKTKTIETTTAPNTNNNNVSSAPSNILSVICGLNRII